MAFNSWFAQNTPPNAGLQHSAHVWGRQEFAKSFAGGGFASTVFAQNRMDMITSPWRRKVKQGSPQYMKNLRELQKLHRDNPNIAKAIKDAQKGSPRVGGGLLSGVMMAGFVAMPAFTTDGPLSEKARAVTSGIGSFAGWEVGSKLGTGLGAAIGSVVPVVGTAIGAAVGYVGGGLIGSLAGEGLTDAITRIPDRMVDRERNRRSLDWGVHTKAFQTRRAHTMRQQSLAAMNRGQMSARSLLGQEAVFVHR